MAFQDSAESLVERLHLSRVPGPVFIAIALALAVMVVLAAWTFASTAGAELEVRAAEEGTVATASDAGAPPGISAIEDAKDVGRSEGTQDGEDVVLPAGDAVERKQICVHVDGCVTAPGVYYLAVGSRVIDAVSAAGGATAEARTDAVNLAQEVQDGQQIIIPSRSEEQQSALAEAPDGASAGESQGSAGSSAPSEKNGLVNLNTASAEELQTLKGVGAATADKIIADREANGPFKSIDDLTRVSGIGEKKLAAMRDRLCL